MKRLLRPLAIGLLLVPLSPLFAGAQEVGSLLARIKTVGREGAGNVEAAKAWRELVKAGPEALPQVLAGLDDAGPRAANWIRSAVETIADQALASGKNLPADRLEMFVKDTKHTGAARRLAYEQLVRVDPSAPARLLPGMINDPGPELRREAVAVLLKKAQAYIANENKQAALPAYQKALSVARDQDQVKFVAARLKTLGVDVDLTKHFGFITEWMLAGPFDNTGGKGFHTNYPPEKAPPAPQGFLGKGGKKVAWQKTTTTLALGIVDLNKVFPDEDQGRLREAVAYAYAAVETDKERPIEIRCGSNNAVRIYLNGKEIFFREEYHHGMEMDQHAGKGTLKAGRNDILIKVCQNDQDEVWARNWSFQLRVCDHLGAATPVKNVTGRN